MMNAETSLHTPKPIAILGSTGSIGTQALEVVAHCAGAFRVVALTAGSQWQVLARQAHQFRPEYVAVADEAALPPLREALAGLPGIIAEAGPQALERAAAWPTAHTVLTSMVGFAGLRPTMAALRAGKHIALANKETLVVAGALVMAEARRRGLNILPVDSEHSALFQCLLGEDPASVEKLILTASGGPFRGRSTDELARIGPAQALKHPNWAMGAKITIDSATLMNKGLEVIEAHWLFGTPLSQIDVVVHPQSIVHSLVQFKDGSLKAQMGLPDMKLPIQLALGYPSRGENAFPRTDLLAIGPLTFEPPDRATFRSLDFAYHALEKGGNLPCVLNAANEVAVAAFLREEISFLDIYRMQERALETAPFVAAPSLEDLFATDTETRARCQARA